MVISYEEKDEFLKIIVNMAESVYDFHKRFNVISISDKVEDLDWKILAQRVLLQCEEVGELCKALNRGSLSEALEESADALYIALGTIVSLNRYGLEACKKVVEKNNSKTPLNCSLSTTGKILKDVQI